MSIFFKIAAFTLAVFCVVADVFLLMRGVSVLNLIPLVFLQIFAILIGLACSREDKPDEIRAEGKKA